MCAPLWKDAAHPPSWQASEQPHVGGGAARSTLVPSLMLHRNPRKAQEFLIRVALLWFSLALMKISYTVQAINRFEELFRPLSHLFLTRLVSETALPHLA